MSVNKAKTTESFRNNGGAAINVGTPNNSPISSNLKSKANDVGVFGSAPAATFDVKENFFGVPLGSLNDITTTLNTLYQTPVPSLTKSIHKTESSTSLQYTTAFRNGYYNMYTGKFLVAPTVSSDSFGNDDAARPSRDVPGELVYRTGAKRPVEADYPSKNG